MGRGSPWRGSRDMHRRDSCAVVVKAWWPVRYRWGVVALGVVVEIWTSRTKREKGKNGNDINRAHKNPQPQFLLWKSFQHIYETHEIRRSMIFSTVSCLESDNDVSTSNSPPARNIVRIYPDYFCNVHCRIPKYYRTELFTQIWKTKNVAVVKTLKSIPCFCKHTHDHYLVHQVYAWYLVSTSASTVFQVQYTTPQTDHDLGHLVPYVLL